MNLDFNAMGVTLDNYKDAVNALNDYVKSLRASAKETVATMKAGAVAKANDMISAGRITAGAKVVVRYNHKDIVGTIKSTPAVTSKNLPVVSDDFENKDKFLYVNKENFVDMAA